MSFNMQGLYGCVIVSLSPFLKARFNGKVERGNWTELPVDGKMCQISSRDFTPRECLRGEPSTSEMSKWPTYLAGCSLITSY